MNDELTAALQNLALWMQHHDQQTQELLRRIPEAGVTVTPKKPPKPARVPHVPRAVVNVATGQEYPSPAAACRACGASRSNMAMHLKGYHKTIKGHVFRYKDQAGTSATPAPTPAPAPPPAPPPVPAGAYRVVNHATGEVYHDEAIAAKSIGVPRAKLMAHLYGYPGTIKGTAFSYYVPVLPEDQNLDHCTP